MVTDFSLNDSNISVSGTEKIYNCILFKLVIPKFFGDIENWFEFFNCFEMSIH